VPLLTPRALATVSCVAGRSLIMSLAFTIGGYSPSWSMALAIVGVALFVGFIIYECATRSADPRVPCATRSICSAHAPAADAPPPCDARSPSSGVRLHSTYMIITRLGVDDYIIAAIELYLDVINMFLFVLQLLVLCGGRR
jgi:hypothetical protein